MTSTRIAMLSDHQDNQNPRIWRTAITLAELGYDVTLYCQRTPDSEIYEYKERVHVKRVFDFKLGTTVLIDKYLTAHFQLRDALLKEEQPFDVFHCHDPETWPIGFIFAKHFNAKFIADSHEYFPDYIEKKYYGNDQIKYKTSVLLSKNRGNYVKEADGLIAVSEGTLKALCDDFNLTCPKTVIYNTRHSSDILQTNKNELRKKLKLDDDIKYMAFAGNVMPDRGIETVIKIVQKMPANYKLIIIGDGLLAKDIIKIQQSSDKIIYLGRLSYKELIEYVYVCDAYLYFPNHYGINALKNYKYTIPNKLFDAIFSDIPFFTYDGFAFSELVKKYEVGTVYSINENIQNIADDIVDKIESSCFKERAFSEAQKAFSWENQKNKLKSLYNSVLK